MSEVALVRSPALAAPLAGFALARRRMRGPVAVTALLAIALAATVALVEHRHGQVGAADRALLVVGRLVIPLASFAVAGAAIGRARLGDATWCLARLGLPRRSVALGLCAGAMLASAAVAVVASLVVLVVCHGAKSALPADAVTTSWIAALGAAAYVGWFCFGAGFFRLGRGRWLPLGLDFTVGSGAGALASMWPRAHLRSLLGGTPVLDLAQPASSVLLGATVAAMLVAAAWRAGD